MPNSCADCKKEISEKEQFVKLFEKDPKEVFCIDCVNSGKSFYKKLDQKPDAKKPKKLKAVW